MSAKKPSKFQAENQNLIEVRNVTKTFGLSGRKFTALQDISFGVKKGQLFAVTGRSGSGKSTILNIISGIDRPNQGHVSIGGLNIDSLDENSLAAWRGKNVGVVFQFFQLLPTLTILENIILPMDFCNIVPNKERKGRALSLLKQVGILDQANKLPSELSGGQQQRAAIARALANDPPILVADEPTGNLDSHASDSIFELFIQLADEGKTVIVVTHEREIARWATDVITLSDGQIIENSPANRLSLKGTRDAA